MGKTVIANSYHKILQDTDFGMIQGLQNRS
jgi:hypothetical protein